MPKTKRSEVFNRQYAILSALTAAVLLPFTLIYVPLSWYINVAVAITAGFIIWWAIISSKHMASYKRTERQSEEWMRAVQPVNQWLSDRQWQRLCHVLGQTGSVKKPADRSVLLVTRKSWYFGFLQIFPVVVVAISLLALLGAMIMINLPASVTKWWWLIPPTLILVAVVGWVRLFSWLYWYFIIDDEHVILVQLPPAWLFWLNDPTQPMPLSIGQLVREEPMGFFGNVLRFGRLMFATNLQDSEDKDFRDIPYLPRHKQIAVMLRSNIGTNRVRY